MQIVVDDHAPGAGAGRKAYLEDRTRRVLGRMSEQVERITLALGPDEQYGDHCRVRMAAWLSRGEVLEASTQRRLLPDALADTFDALVTRIALCGLRTTSLAGEDDDANEDEDELAFVRPVARRPAHRPRAF